MSIFLQKISMPMFDQNTVLERQFAKFIYDSVCELYASRYLCQQVDNLIFLLILFLVIILCELVFKIIKNIVANQIVPLKYFLCFVVKFCEYLRIAVRITLVAQIFFLILGLMGYYTNFSLNIKHVDINVLFSDGFFIYCLACFLFSSLIMISYFKISSKLIFIWCNGVLFSFLLGRFTIDTIKLRLFDKTATFVLPDLCLHLICICVFSIYLLYKFFMYLFAPSSRQQNSVNRDI